MQYILLIYDEEAARPDPPPEDAKKWMQAWWDYTAAMKDAGCYIAGDALTPVSTATTVRVREGKTLTTDGPFAETKEQLGGYYLIDAADLDEALEWAARCPGSWNGSVEVRPILVLPSTEEGG